MKLSQKIIGGVVVLASAIGSSILKAKGYKVSSLLLLLAGVLGGIGAVVYMTFAAELTKTPTDIASGDETVLRSYIAADATTITLEPLYKYVNGTRTKGCIDTPAGFALLQDVSKTETISYGTKACNTTTYVTTLTDVRRGLSMTGATFFGGTGMAFDAGSIFKVIDYPIFYENAMYKDIENTMSGSGAQICDATTQPCFYFGQYTTAQRDALNFDTSRRPMIFNTTTNTYQMYDGSQWVNNGSGAIVNATTALAGKVRIAEYFEIIAGLFTGSDSNTLVLSPNHTKMVSDGTKANSGTVVITNSGGVIDRSIGGTGSGAFTASGIIFAGPNYFESIVGTTSGAILVWNDEEWVQIPASFPQTLCNTTTDSGNNDTTSFALYDQTCTIGSGTLAVGDSLDVLINIKTDVAHSHLAKIAVNSDRFEAINDAGTTTIQLTATLTVRSLGTTGSLEYMGRSTGSGATVAKSVRGAITFDSAQPLVIGADGKAGGTGGTNQITLLRVIKYPSP